MQLCEPMLYNWKCSPITACIITILIHITTSVCLSSIKDLQQFFNETWVTQLPLIFPPLLEHILLSSLSSAN